MTAILKEQQSSSIINNDTALKIGREWGTLLKVGYERACKHPQEAISENSHHWKRSENLSDADFFPKEK